MPDIENEPTLHFLVGGLHSKVDILLSREEANSARIDSLERRYWIGAGVAGAVTVYFATATGKLESFLKLFI